LTTAISGSEVGGLDIEIISRPIHHTRHRAGPGVKLTTPEPLDRQIANLL